MDDYNSLSQRLLLRCPQVSIALSQQLINDSWRELQSMRQWSFRRRSGTFAPPNLYQTGTCSTNVANGLPTTITGSGTFWITGGVNVPLPGQQIRLGGLFYPYYTIVAIVSDTQLLIDQPWAGPDVANIGYQTLQAFYPVPQDFGFWYVVVSIKNAYRLWTDVTQDDLALFDPQRANYQETYTVSFRDYTSVFGGTIGPAIPVGQPQGQVPVSTTTAGYSYVANATYVIQVHTTGLPGTATYYWYRAGSATPIFNLSTSQSYPVDLMDGVQIYWPNQALLVAGDSFIINAQSQVVQGTPRYELWPPPTVNNYLYPYIYIAKEYDLTAQAPQLPPFVANRGEVLLEMALAKAARYPGPSMETKNPYFNLALATMHDARAQQMIWDLERNDEEVGVTNITYENLPMAYGPWFDGAYQAHHAPFLRG